MIKVFGLIPRRLDVTPEEFHAHYRHPHGTLALTTTTGVGYVQSHQIHSDLLAADQARFEAVMEVWAESEAKAASLRDDPNAIRYLTPDEPKFIDMKNHAYIFTTEEVVDGGGSHGNEADRLWTPVRHPFSIKLIQFIRQGSDWFDETITAACREIGALRHVRCHPAPAFQPAEAEFLGVRELWWPTIMDFRLGVSRAPDAWRLVVDRSGPALTLLAQADRFLSAPE